VQIALGIDNLKATFYWPCLPAILAVSLVLTFCAHDASATKRRSVEVWCGGDDGLTLGLRDALEKAFASSPDFYLSRGRTPGSLIVTIPTHVRWMKVEKRTWVDYAVEFDLKGNHHLGKDAGSCWDDEIQECAAQIVIEARAVARKTQ
jgi:hypothetical protein